MWKLPKFGSREKKKDQQLQTKETKTIFIQTHHNQIADN